jgi:hypothetical protein
VKITSTAEFGLPIADSQDQPLSAIRFPQSQEVVEESREQLPLPVEIGPADDTAPVTPARPDEASEALLPTACDACFAKDTWDAAAPESGGLLSPAGGALPTELGSPAALVALAALFCGFQGGPSEERGPRKRWLIRR